MPQPYFGGSHPFEEMTVPGNFEWNEQEWEASRGALVNFVLPFNFNASLINGNKRRPRWKQRRNRGTWARENGICGIYCLKRFENFSISDEFFFCSEIWDIHNFWLTASVFVNFFHVCFRSPQSRSKDPNNLAIWTTLMFICKMNPFIQSLKRYISNKIHRLSLYDYFGGKNYCRCLHFFSLEKNLMNITFSL